MSGEVFYGRTVRRSEGSQTAKGIVGRRTVGSFYSVLVLPEFQGYFGIENLAWASKIQHIPSVYAGL